MLAMRKYLVLPVLGVCLLVGALGTTALAGSSTYYAGSNSQHQKLLFSVDQTAGGPKFDPFFTTMAGRCPATHEGFVIEFTFQGFQIPIKNGHFSLALNDISDRFLWSGTIGPKKASGEQSYQLAGFDHQGGLQDCATGSLGWKAQALVRGSSKAMAPSATYHMTVTRASNGSVHFSLTH
jgi:hypothetical protein